jgi:hypothetical protein
MLIFVAGSIRKNEDRLTSILVHNGMVARTATPWSASAIGMSHSFPHQEQCGHLKPLFNAANRYSNLGLIQNNRATPAPEARSCGCQADGARAPCAPCIRLARAVRIFEKTATTTYLRQPSRCGPAGVGVAAFQSDMASEAWTVPPVVLSFRLMEYGDFVATEECKCAGY